MRYTVVKHAGGQKFRSSWGKYGTGPRAEVTTGLHRKYKGDAAMKAKVSATARIAMAISEIFPISHALP